MPLTLTLRNVSALSDGGPIKLQLDRRGAVIGRSPTVEWTLPDPSNYISSRHYEVRYETDVYQLRDTSTNGTMINGTAMTGPHRLSNGDVITIGHYEIAVTAPRTAPIQQDTDRDWGGWKDVSSALSDPDAGSDWGKPKPKAPIAGDGLIGGNWVPPIAGVQQQVASWGRGPASTQPQDSPSAFPAPNEVRIGRAPPLFRRSRQRDAISGAKWRKVIRSTGPVAALAWLKHPRPQDL
jgi:type VI secretion system protein